jgi:sialidase-1
LSDDDGKKWSRGLVLDERVSISYPDGDQADDGRIYIIYDYLRRTDKEILLAVVTEADIEAGRISDPRSRLRVMVNKATGRR